MDNEKIAIITPFKNASQFVDNYLNSLLSQTYKNWHCYLINDGSKDNSFDLIKDLTKNDERFFLLNSSKENISLGPAISRNVGLRASNESLICFLDIDDLWHPNKLELQIKFFIENDLDICVTSYCKFQGKTINSKSIIDPPLNLEYKNLLKRNYIPLLTVLLRRDLNDFIFPNTKHEDYAMWLNIFWKNPNIRYGSLRKTLCYYRIHKSNITSNKIKMLIWIFKAYRTHGIKSLKASILVFRLLCIHLLNLFVIFFKNFNVKRNKIKDLSKIDKIIFKNLFTKKM